MEGILLAYSTAAVHKREARMGAREMWKIEVSIGGRGGSVVERGGGGAEWIHETGARQSTCATPLRPM